MRTLPSLMLLLGCLIPAWSAASAQTGAPWLELAPLTAAEKAAVRDEFVALNGPAWNGARVEVHPYAPFVWIAAGADAGDASAAIAPDAALEHARQFMRRNGALFGLEPWDVAYGLRFEFVGPSAMGNVFVSGTAPRPYPQYWDVPSFTYDIDLRLDVHAGGVHAVINRTERFTRIDGLETTPRVAFDAPEVVGAMVGRLLTFHDDSGQPVTVGPVAPLDIRPLGLTIDVGSRAGGLWAGLVWRYLVLVDGLPWEFTFSAVTGEEIWVEQLFDT